MKSLLVCLLLIFSVTQTISAQNAGTLAAADSLFTKQNWKAAKAQYLSYLSDTSTNARAWNRLGYCNQNLGLYADALTDYTKVLACNPAPPVMSMAQMRMARVYSLMNKTDEAGNWLIKATTLGYYSLPDLDTLADFKNLRKAANFSFIRQKVYETTYPCTAEPHSRDFSFWIGEWDVYQTGTKSLVGHSVVQSISGDCAMLENWKSTQASNGKSINYYNTQTGKWEQDWIGSAGGPQRYLNGEYKDGAMRFIYETTGPKGKKVTGNFIFYNIDKDTVRQYQDVINDDKTVTVSYDFTYIRKK